MQGGDHPISFRSSDSMLFMFLYVHSSLFMGWFSRPDAVSKMSKTNPLGDERFGAMFQSPDFEIDPESEEYARIHPGSAVATKMVRRGSFVRSTRLMFVTDQSICRTDTGLTLHRVHGSYLSN